jgi:hypothetical protein
MINKPALCKSKFTHNYHSLLWVLLPIVASCSANQELLTREPSTARYKREGHTTQVPTRAVYAGGRADGTDVLTVIVGRSPRPGDGSFIISYAKPTGAPITAYKATVLTYTYVENSVVIGTNYSAHLRGTLTPTPRGGFSGTFHGTRLGDESDKRSTIKGTFTDVRP